MFLAAAGFVETWLAVVVLATTLARVRSVARRTYARRLRREGNEVLP